MAIAKVQTSAISAYQGNSTTVVAGTSTGYQRTLTVTAGSLLTARIAIRNTGASGGLISAVTDSRSQTWNLRRSQRDTLEAGYGWIYLFDCFNAAAGSTTISLDCTLEDTSNLIVWEVTEWSGAMTSAANDVGDNDTVDGDASSITTGPTATLAQADSLYVGLVGGKWWYEYNGDNSPPSNWVKDAESTNNTYVGFQSVSRVVSSTTGLSVAWTVPAFQSANEGGSALIQAYKASAATRLRVRALFNTAINSDASITALVWTGDPTTTYAREFTALTAEAAGGILFINLPSTGYTNGQSVNVLAYNSVDESGLITATVETY